jgi:hypothetical protein
MFASQEIGDNMSIGDCGHGGKSVVFRFALIDLTAVSLNSSLRSLQLGPKEYAKWSVKM